MKKLRTNGNKPPRCSCDECQAGDSWCHEYLDGHDAGTEAGVRKVCLRRGCLN